jgi:hypothetical protein
MALAAIAALIILCCALPYIGRSWQPPERSLKALKLAAHRRDRETVAMYVDAVSLAQSFRNCALQSARSELARRNAEGFSDRVVNSLTEELAGRLADATYTPESVISMLCGEDPKSAMKPGLENYIVKGVDAVTPDGTRKTEVYEVIGKFLDRWAQECAAEAGTRGAMGEEPQPHNESAQYESSGRYLITLKPRNTNELCFGVVLSQRGVSTWKFTELRLLAR